VRENVPPNALCRKKIPTVTSVAATGCARRAVYAGALLWGQRRTLCGEKGRGPLAHEPGSYLATP